MDTDHGCGAMVRFEDEWLLWVLAEIDHGSHHSTLGSEVTNIQLFEYDIRIFEFYYTDSRWSGVVLGAKVCLL